MNNKEIIKTWINKRSIYNPDIKLLPLQLVVLNKIDKNDALFIFDEVGFGKTIEAAWCIWKIVCLNEKAKILIVTQKNVEKQFREDIEKFIGEDCFIKNVTVVNSDYRNLEKIVFKDNNYDLIIIDEAHEFKNNELNKKSIKRSYCERLSANKLVIMTATPIKNKLEELQSLINLSKSILKNSSREIIIPKAKDFIGFNEDSCWLRNFKYCINTGAGKDVSIGKRKFPNIQIYEYKSNIVDNLLDTDICNIYKDSGNIFLKIKTHIDEINREINRISGDERYKHTVSILNKKKKELNMYLDVYKRVLKIDVNIDIIKKIEEIDDKIKCLDKFINEVYIKNKLVIFVTRKETGEYLSKYLKFKYNNKLKVTYINGGTKNRDKIIEEEKSDNNSDIFIMTEGIGTVGLNLKKFNYVIHYELPFSPADLEQRFGRIDRIGTKYEYLNNIYFLHKYDHKNLKIYYLDNDIFNINMNKFLPTIITPIPSKNIIFSKDQLVRYFKNIQRNIYTKKNLLEYIKSIHRDESWNEILELFNNEINRSIEKNNYMSRCDIVEKSKSLNLLKKMLDKSFKIEKIRLDSKFEKIHIEKTFEDEKLKQELARLYDETIKSLKSRYKDMKNVIEEYVYKSIVYIENGNELTSTIIKKILEKDIEDLKRKDNLDIKDIDKIEDNIFYFEDNTLKIVDIRQVLEQLECDIKKSKIYRDLKEIQGAMY